MRTNLLSIALLSTLLLVLTSAPLVQSQTDDPPAQTNTSLGVQAFLDSVPGPLKSYTEGDQTAAMMIESNSLYYGVSPRLLLTLLEAMNSLLSRTDAPPEVLSQPFGPAGPSSFRAQMEWASKAIRTGLGPYTEPPIVTFVDGTSLTLSLDQAMEGVAVQRFMAIGHTAEEWYDFNERFVNAFQTYFQNQLLDLSPGPVNPNPPAAEEQNETVPPPDPDSGPGASVGNGSTRYRFLHLPWPEGVAVEHLAYFDHVYPTVDSGGDGNNAVVTYFGTANVQYNSHDGHDYVFTDQPIGTPILAAAPGTAFAYTHPGNGVVILHQNGYETVYWHLDTFDSRFTGAVNNGVGIPVQTGDMLGTSGMSGFTIGTPHLHFEVRHYGRQVDPYAGTALVLTRVPNMPPVSIASGCGTPTSPVPMILVHPMAASRGRSIHVAEPL